VSGTTEIRQALVSRLIAVSPGAAIPAASVAWENRDYTPAVGTRWYRATFLPGQSVAAAVGVDAQNRHVGLFQIDIIDPTGSGDMVTQTEAERIIACYKRGTVLTYTGVSLICDRAYRLPANQEEDWFVIPVIVEYRADTAN
jgi:hypothetical protein